MVLIQIHKEDQEKVFEVLLSNGKFRAFSNDRFDLVEHPEEVLQKLINKNIPFRKL